MNDRAAIEDSLRYLKSDEALKSISANYYWPKWNSPWWHMSVLYEMGLGKHIPRVAAQHLVDVVKKEMLPLFFEADVPPGYDPALNTPCPCSLGNLYQILSSAGLDVDSELPWARGWFLKYQLPDGGFNCDEEAYRAHPPASSIVGTIAPLEAILYFTNRDFTKEEADFLDRGARCLIDRELRLGCNEKFNLEEKEDEQDWLKPCFPRFYLYDVLRGLLFILRWAEKRNQTLPAQAIEVVVKTITEKFQDHIIRIERHAFEGVGTRMPNAEGKWVRGFQASHFPLLDQVSQIGNTSPYLTAKWVEAKALIEKLRIN